MLADQLGITTNNCHVVLHRARAKLRAALEEHWDSTLVLAYGECGRPGEPAGDVLGRIAQGEKWLQRMP